MTLEGEDKKGNAVSVCDVDNLENLCCALHTAGGDDRDDGRGGRCGVF